METSASTKTYFRWRMALDIGTNSIGFVAYDLEGNLLIHKGVRIFSDGRSKDGLPKNVERRESRQISRQNERKNKRLKLIFNFFIKEGLIEKEDKKELYKINPYQSRAEGLDRRLTEKELSRAFIHLHKRRAFLSNRKDNSSKDDDKKINLKKINAFKSLLKEENHRTLGEYFYLSGRSVRFRPKESDFYPSRDMIEDEFYALKKEQEKYYKELNWQRLYDLIFYQRPLKSGVKGKCQFYRDFERAYKMMPSSNVFRILQDINYLKLILPNKKTRFLDNREKELIFNLLNRQKKVSFNKIRKILDIDCSFNLESRTSDFLHGNPIAVDMRSKKYFGDRWDSFSIDQQDELIDILFTADFETEIKKFVENLGLSEEQIANYINYPVKKDMAHLSSEFMRDCIKTMYKPEWYTLEEAKSQLNIDQDNFTPGTYEELPYYGEILEQYVVVVTSGNNEIEKRYGKIGNPTVHIVLNEVRKVINSLIEKFGKPEECVIETSRDLKMNQKAKINHLRSQKIKEKTNQRIDALIEEHGFTVTKNLRTKLKLWDELGTDAINRKCIYCGKPISLSQVFTYETEVDHIWPYSQSLIDSFDNYILCHKSCNQYKKNRTPENAFGNNQDGYDYDAIISRAQETLYKFKASKFLPGTFEDYTKENNFVNSQLSDTAYVTKVVCKYVSAICEPNKIWSVKGSLVAMMRHHWGLNHYLSSSNSKNRFDHRHHIIDALVLSLIDRKLLFKLSNLNRDYKKGANFQVPDFPLKIKDIIFMLEDVLPSIRPQRGKNGKLFKKTALGLKHFDIICSLKDMAEDEVDQIIDEEKKLQFKDYIVKYSFKKAKKLLLKEWSKNANEVKLLCRVPKLVSRKDLDDLNPVEIKRIVDNDLKKAILAEVNVENCSLKEFKEKMAAFSKKYKIRRTRIFPDNVENAAVKIKSVPNKYYLAYDYLFVDIWKIPYKNSYKYQGQFCRRIDAYNTDFKLQRPHPAAQKIMRLYKNDIICIYDRLKDEFHFAEIEGFSSTNNQLKLRSIYASKDNVSWKKNTNTFLIDDFFITNGQKKAINHLWTHFDVKKVNVPVDGLSKERYIETNFRNINRGDVFIY